MFKEDQSERIFVDLTAVDTCSLVKVILAPPSRFRLVFLLLYFPPLLCQPCSSFARRLSSDAQYLLPQSTSGKSSASYTRTFGCFRIDVRIAFGGDQTLFKMLVRHFTRTISYKLEYPFMLTVCLSVRQFFQAPSE